MCLEQAQAELRHAAELEGNSDSLALVMAPDLSRALADLHTWAVNVLASAIENASAQDLEYLASKVKRSVQSGMEDMS